MPCGAFLLWVCMRRIAGFCTHYCGFLFYTPYCGFLCRDSASPIARFLLLYTPYCGFLLRVSIRSVACFNTPFCGILYALLRVSIRPVAGSYTPCCGVTWALLQVSLPTGAEVTMCGRRVSKSLGILPPVNKYGYIRVSG